MPSQKGLSIIRKIQEYHVFLETQFDAKIPVILEDLYKKTESIILDANLPQDPKKRAEAIKAIRGIRRDVVEAMATLPVYVQSVGQLTAGMSELKVLTDSYFSELIDGYSNKPALYEQILISNIESVKDKMLGAGIRDNFGNAIADALRTNIAGNSSRTQINKAVRDAIFGTVEEKSQLEKYVKLVSQDSVMTFNREYVEVVTTDLELEKWFYAGTLIEDSRPFCKARAGRYFTKSEIESWASLGKWAGRKPNTTKKTIFVYLGGFYCRHQAWPVTDAEYHEQAEKGKTGMK
jgi:hypothetical protein